MKEQIDPTPAPRNCQIYRTQYYLVRDAGAHRASGHWSTHNQPLLIIYGAWGWSRLYQPSIRTLGGIGELKNDVNYNRKDKKNQHCV